LRLSVLLFGICAVCAATPTLAAQQQSRPAQGGIPLVPGTRVRVSAASLVTPLVANYMELRGDTLIVFDESGGRGVWSFGLDQVRRLETTAGQVTGHRRHIMRWGLIGAAAGAGAGLLFAASADPSDPGRKYSRPLTAGVGAVVGGLLGAFVGSRIRAEGWTPVPLPRHASVTPSGRGGLRVAFGY
jgi:hypothetical protein